MEMKLKPNNQYFCFSNLNMKRFFLEVVVFICGAVVMAYEIVGSRMLGPFVGTSIFVWSSIIGIILLSLSLGYFYGGKIADKNPHYKYLSIIVVLSAMLIVASTLLKDILLDNLLNLTKNVKLVSILASLLLFSLPALFLGMVSPFAARLKMVDIKTSGATVGYLYALSTLGSITGTFLAGFYLIPSFRITTILFILAFFLTFSAAGLYLIYGNKEMTIVKE
jgi:predicted membrane-bound spermidine synthase